MSYFNLLRSFVVKKKVFLQTLLFLWRVLARFTFSLKEGAYLCSFLYLKYPKLLVYDIRKVFYSLWKNPYAQLRRLPQSSLLKDGNVYGETPWSALYTISKAFGITSNEVLYDLGCGLGKACFWFSHVVRCQVIGIDNQMEFIHFSSKAHRKLSSVPALFCLQNFQEVSLARASYVYFYGSSYSRRVLRSSMQVFSELPTGRCVISISFPLDSLPGGRELFSTEKSCFVRFPWGKTIAYKNIRK